MQMVEISSTFEIFEDVISSLDLQSVLLPFIKAGFEVGMIAYISESTGPQKGETTKYNIIRQATDHRITKYGIITLIKNLQGLQHERKQF
jgi:hypothetical protein